MNSMKNKEPSNKVYFSDVFEVKHSIVQKYGALDISLICDNPAFVDPFLIFADSKYRNLHDLIIKYLKFLRDLSLKKKGSNLTLAEFNHYYKFPEIKQVWLGYSMSGNIGRGLNKDFGYSLYRNLHEIFSKFGDEDITESAHLEKLCLIEERIGVDKISDFTINLIQKFLLEYTQEFAKEYLDKRFLSEFAIRKVEFDFEKGIWDDGRFVLPMLQRNGKRDFVLLVPRKILTKEDIWISRNDFLECDTAIFGVIPNEELRAKINKFFIDNLHIKINKKKQQEKDYSKKSKRNALSKTILEYPQLMDYYIKLREKGKYDALKWHIVEPEGVNFFTDATQIQSEIKDENFGKLASFNDCVSRISFFKKILESNSRDLYFKGKPLQERHLRVMFKNTTHGSLFDYNSEVNNGRGPIDFIISFGSQDKLGLELKLAANKKLKQNLLNQGQVYKEDSNLNHVFKIIFFFSDEELEKVNKILKELNKSVDNEEIFLIDCRKKESGSNQKQLCH